MKRLVKLIDSIATGRVLLSVCLAAVALAVGNTPAQGADKAFRYLAVRHIQDISGDFNQPTEVAVSKAGRIYVLDGANNKVKIFNQQGELLLSFGSPGSEAGEFRQPVGLDLDARENIYVADTGNQRIQVFDRHGSYIRMIDLAAEKVRPVEVELSPQGDRLYISDARNHQILCYNLDGSQAFTWGRQGKLPGEFTYPGMADTDVKGNIHVVDILNGRLQIFDQKGENPREVGGFGITPGKLFRPKGIVVDRQSQVYVSDSYTGVIQVFDNKGKLIGILSEDMRKPLRLTTPLGMALDAEKGYLYVVETEENKVSVFELRGKI